MLSRHLFERVSSVVVEQLSDVYSIIRDVYLLVYRPANRPAVASRLSFAFIEFFSQCFDILIFLFVSVELLFVHFEGIVSGVAATITAAFVALVEVLVRGLEFFGEDAFHNVSLQLRFASDGWLWIVVFRLSDEVANSFVSHVIVVRDIIGVAFGVVSFEAIVEKIALLGGRVSGRVDWDVEVDRLSALSLLLPFHRLVEQVLMVHPFDSSVVQRALVSIDVLFGLFFLSREDALGCLWFIVDRRKP